MNITNLQGTTKLHNGVNMPYFGLGVWKAREGQEVSDAVLAALQTGYRLIDTAAIYRNEAGVGQGIAQAELSRRQVFITSKVWNADQGYDSTVRACQASLKRLGVDFLDLYLVHWPVKKRYKETWRALETLYQEGYVRAIGVSNFLQHHLEDLLGTARVVPMVNQMEFHPYLVQPELLEFCRRQRIQYQAWSPLMQGKVLEVPLLQELGEKYGRTPVQVVLRWNLQMGVATIPKSVRPNRIEDNARIFDFELEEGDVARICGLDRGQRFGPDPDNFEF